MVAYKYEGVTKRGKVKKGTLEADNKQILRQHLKKQGIFVTQIGEKKNAKGGILSQEIDFNRLLERITPQDISTFTRQLATLTRARIPLVSSLNACAEQMQKMKLKEIITTMSAEVNEGASFAQALDKRRDVFGPLFSNMVRSGEASGTLDEVLLKLAEFSESSVKLREKISSAMMYPIIMVAVGSLILIGLFIGVIPQITQIFEDTGQDLPLVTTLIIGFSQLLQDYWMAGVVLFFSVLYGSRWYLSTPKGRMRWDTFKLRIPVFGKLWISIDISRFTKTLATLLNSGVPLLTALDITKNVIENVHLTDLIHQARNDVKEGSTLAAPLKETGRFPIMMVQMISIGERSGALEDMLTIVSETTENEVDTRVSQMTTLLEPLMLLGMGVVITIIVFAILLPILQMNEFMN
jgi:general secretion pathway protein F